MKNSTLRFFLIRSVFFFLLVLATMPRAKAQGLVPDQTEFEVLKDLYDEPAVKDMEAK